MLRVQGSDGFELGRSSSGRAQQWKGLGQESGNRRLTLVIKASDSKTTSNFNLGKIYLNVPQRSFIAGAQLNAL